MRRIDGLVQLVLGITLILGTVYACVPSTSAGDELLSRQCRQHLSLCQRCRDRHLTPARMLAQNTPTRCYSFGAIADAPAYQLSPANSGQ
jgi:hypothetical protein